MGANAATKCYKVLDNVERILGIEMLNAAQALEYRCKKFNIKTSSVLEKFVKAFRTVVDYTENDGLMYPKMHKAVQFVQECVLE
jgi:histidine ammonia-lyase